MKKWLLKLCSKICYKLADKVSLDLDKDEINDLIELGDKLLALANSL